MNLTASMQNSLERGEVEMDSQLISSDSVMGL